MLKIRNYQAKSLKFSENSSYHAGRIDLCKKEINAYCLEGIEEMELNFETATPEESVRIVHVTDTVMPVWKEKGSTFVGWTEGEDLCGQGVLHRMHGVTVMQTCKYPGIQEAIVDMSGTGSRYCKFSGMINLVISVELKNKEYDKVLLAKNLNLILLRAAEYLGKLTRDKEPDSQEILEEKGKNKELLKIGYVYYIQAQGPLRNVFIKGADCTQMKPRFMNFCEILDGALVSGNYIIACQKNPTYFHQYNPVINELIQRNGTELNAVGVIVSTESGLLEKKKENAQLIARQAKEKGMQGVIITQEGGGHADVDLMFALEACEEEGIAAVIETNELAGANGELPPLVASSPRADAIVTNGNNDEIIYLDSVEKVIGGSRILDGKSEASASLETGMGILYTSTNQLGVNCMKTVML